MPPVPQLGVGRGSWGVGWDGVGLTGWVLVGLVLGGWGSGGVAGVPFPLLVLVLFMSLSLVQAQAQRIYSFLNNWRILLDIGMAEFIYGFIRAN